MALVKGRRNEVKHVFIDKKLAKAEKHPPIPAVARPLTNWPTDGVAWMGRSLSELHVSTAHQLPFVSNLIGIANMAAIDADMARIWRSWNHASAIWWPFFSRTQSADGRNEYLLNWAAKMSRPHRKVHSAGIGLRAHFLFRLSALTGIYVKVQSDRPAD